MKLSGAGYVLSGGRESPPFMGSDEGQWM